MRGVHKPNSRCITHLENTHSPCMPYAASTHRKAQALLLASNTSTACSSSLRMMCVMHRLISMYGHSPCHLHQHMHALSLPSPHTVLAHNTFAAYGSGSHCLMRVKHKPSGRCWHRPGHMQTLSHRTHCTHLHRTPPFIA